MPAVSGGRVAEIAPGVFALSCLLDLSRPLSWVDPAETGFDPCTCYLIRDQVGGAAHLVDTGPRAQGELLACQLAELITPATPLDITLTRVEPDSLGNLDTLADRFRVVRVSSQSNVIPFDYLGPLSARYPDTIINNGMLPGDVVEWAGGRRLVAVEPAVRTLPTMWYLDEPTGTLLTSDFFGDVHVDAGWTPRPPDLERTRRHLLAKFDWLAMADTSAAVAKLDMVAAMPGIRSIGPAHGLWAIGEEAVRELVSRTRQALCETDSTRADRNIVL